MDIAAAWNSNLLSRVSNFVQVQTELLHGQSKCPCSVQNSSSSYFASSVCGHRPDAQRTARSYLVWSHITRFLDPDMRVCQVAWQATYFTLRLCYYPYMRIKLHIVDCTEPGCVADSHFPASYHMSAAVALPESSFETVDRVCLFELSASGCSGNTETQCSA